MRGVSNNVRNARGLKGLSLLYLTLIAAALLLVHGSAYEPAVSFIALYLAVSLAVTAAVALILLPAAQFSEGFTAFFYALYAILLSAATFFTGGVSSELYILYFPLLFFSGLHGSWPIGIAAHAAALVGYALAMLPGVLSAIGVDAPALVLFRLAVFALSGIFALILMRGMIGAANQADYELDEDGSMLLERVESELEARRGVQVGIILVDPGRDLEDLDLLLERVQTRIGEPVLLGEGAVFGIVLSGADDRTVESAARRALAAASSLGASETRAGAAIYPRDARSAGDLLVAAGRALEAAFEIESPSAIVLAGRGQTSSGAENYRVAR